MSTRTNGLIGHCALIVGLLLGSACGTAGQSAHDFPPAMPPVWLTSADFQKLVQPVGEDEARLATSKAGLDAFVVAAIGDGGEARTKAVSEAVVRVKRDLHRLFYDVSFDRAVHPAEDPDFYRSLAMFERRAGLDVDGTFTVREAEVLAHLARVAGETEVYAGWKHVYGDGALARAEGSWVIQGERIACPVNHALITCWRPDRSCTVFSADLCLPSGPPNDLSRGSLRTGVEYFDIVEWTDAQVRARSTTDCRQNELTINWKTDQAFTISTDRRKEGCPVLGPLAKPRVTTLEGYEVVRAFFAERRRLAATASNRQFEDGPFDLISR